jgi:hypothetical protein
MAIDICLTLSVMRRIDIEPERPNTTLRQRSESERANVVGPEQRRRFA